MAEVEGEPSQSECTALSNNDPLPDIYRLNIDCFHEIFECLTICDLLNIGQTSTRLQKIAGDFYRSHYVSKRVNAEKGGLTIDYGRSIDIFSAYIRKVFISGYRLNSYQFIASKCKSLRQIRFQGALLEEGIEYIEHILNEIEVVDLSECYCVREEFYEYFLKYCSILKSLSIKRSGKMRGKSVIIGAGNDWLLRKYPTLEHFELTEIYEIPDQKLKIFFEQNPNVRTFSIDSQSLWDNREAILSANIKLDKLSVEFRSREIKSNNQIFDLLNELQRNGFYDKLHIYSMCVSEKLLEEMFLLPFCSSLEMFHGRFHHIYNTLENLTVLGVDYGDEIHNVEDLPKKLPNLERIFFNEASSDHVFPFVKYSPNLKTIKIFRCQGGSHWKRAMDLTEFNKERRKLRNARKVIIYVNEYYILKENTNFKMVSLERYGWFEWEELNAEFRHKHMAYS